MIILIEDILKYMQGQGQISAATIDWFYIINFYHIFF